MTLPLLPHQREGVRYILKHSSAFVCDDMGMGKTRTVIEAIFKRAVFPILILCPASLKINWQVEIKRWINVDVPIDDVNCEVIILNYERLKKNRYKLKNRNIKQIVIDESHAFKEEGSQRTRIALDLVQQIPYKILMSGTPLLNRPLELLSQLKILNCVHKIGGEEYFLNTFCNPHQTPYGVDYKGCSNLDELYLKMKRVWLRRVKSELENALPQKTIVPIPVCRVKQSAPTSLQEIERFDKIALQYKLPHAVDFIKQLIERGEKVVVFVHHKNIGKHLNLAFPNASVIVGGQTPRTRQENINSFQHGTNQIIICSLLASSVGLTLTASRCAVYIEYPWSPSLLAQSQDRIHRLGQTRDVFIYYLYAKDSIDEYRLNTNNFKKAVIDYVVNGGSL